MHDVLVLILGGGRGARLFPLTRHRSEPAVPIAGKYRLIDIPISNCLNSHLSKIYVLTQYLSVSLHRHISNTYKFTPFSQGFVEVLAAQVTNETAEWYKGTADALRQNLRYVLADSCRDVLVLCGDQLYKMDFQELIRTHHESNADVTLATLPVEDDQVSKYGILKADENKRVNGLVEKPKSMDQLSEYKIPTEKLKQWGMKNPRGNYLANMGIYLFKRDSLADLLEKYPDANDVVTEILSNCYQNIHVQSHLFEGYWEDVGSIKTYFQANLALTQDHPEFDFYSSDLIYTRMRNLPATRILSARFEQCLVSDGCLVEEGADLHRCVLGVRSYIGRNVRMKDVICMGANYFEDETPDVYKQSKEGPHLGVGEGSKLERVIIDKNCRIGKHVQIINTNKKENEDGDNYYIRDGIVVIPNGSIIPDGEVI